MKLLSKIILIITLICLSTISADEYKMKFDKNTIGLVRKMPVYQNPAWVAKVVSKDAKEFYFISPKSMLEFYYNPHKWPDANIKTKEDIKDIVVTDYKTLKPIDAKYAFYIYGSHKISFAGDDLPAFEHIKDAKEFMKKNNGHRILKFEDLKNSLIQLLNGKI